MVKEIVHEHKNTDFTYGEVPGQFLVQEQYRHSVRGVTRLNSAFRGLCTSLEPEVAGYVEAVSSNKK